MVVVRFVDQPLDVADGGRQVGSLALIDQQAPDLFQTCFVHHPLVHRSTR